MAEGLTANLLWTALVIWLLGVFITSRDLPFIVALLVSTIKVAIPLAYFAWFFDQTWTFGDDWAYLQQGNLILTRGYTPAALFTVKGVTLLRSIANTFQFFYVWWNLFAQYCFGAFYYAPVFLNVGVTFIGGFAFRRILEEVQFHPTYQRWGLIFFLLHWDIVTWSSIANLKDILVLTLTIIAFLLLIKILKDKKWWILYGFMLALVLYLLLLLRFYIPVLFLITVGIWMMIASRDRRKYLLFSILGVTLLLVIRLGYMRYVYNLEPYNIIYGTFRFWMSPQPWSIKQRYSFLLLPTIIHWFFAVPSIIGGIVLWYKYKWSRMFILYFLILLVFYGMWPNALGARRRFQLSFIIAWMQFNCLWLVGLALVKRKKIELIK